MIKYEFTDEVKYVFGHTLRRIRAVKDFWNVSEGDLGGYIESNKNLSHDGDCWVGENACVFDEATVSGDAYVHGNASVFGSATIRGNAEVFDEARIYGCADIYGDSEVYGAANIEGSVNVDEIAEIYGSAYISGNARISDYAMINLPHSVMCVTNIGSRADTTTFYKGCDGNIFVTCGCFFGTIEMFEREVERTHNGNDYEKEYKVAIELAKVNIK